MSVYEECGRGGERRGGERRGEEGGRGEEGRWLYLFQCSADGEPGPGPQPVIVG